jgi:hypothetical protein
MYISPREVLSSLNCILTESFDGVKFGYGSTGILVAVNEIDEIHMGVCDNL